MNLCALSTWLLSSIPYARERLFGLSYSVPQNVRCKHSRAAVRFNDPSIPLIEGEGSLVFSNSQTLKDATSPFNRKETFLIHSA